MSLEHVLSLVVGMHILEIQGFGIVAVLRQAAYDRYTYACQASCVICAFKAFPMAVPILFVAIFPG